MRPLDSTAEPSSEINDALAWHDGDARTTIATLLADCRLLRKQIELADQVTSRGFTRGWRLSSDRDDLAE